jgi:hypothetical protein
MGINIGNIQYDFRDKVSEKVRLVSEGNMRFRVFTPFLFEDGDHLSIVLKRENDKWWLSDEGHTYMHLTYDIDEKDFLKGTRQKIITNALSSFMLEDHDRELLFPINEERYGDALFSFAQALLMISDVLYLNREKVRSAFLEDFLSLIANAVPAERFAFDWCDAEHDPEAKYPVDCRIEGKSRPIFVYALPNDDHTRDATIAILQFEKWGLRFRSVGIFEDQENINRRVLSRFSDVCDKQFSGIGSNRERIGNYIAEMMHG